MAGLEGVCVSVLEGKGVSEKVSEIEKSGGEDGSDGVSTGETKTSGKSIGSVRSRDVFEGRKIGEDELCEVLDRLKGRCFS